MTHTISSNIQELKDSLRGDVIIPADDAYPEAISRWSRLAERKAGLVAFVKDAGDVSKAVTWAVANGVEIAVKGGGHNPSGASSSEGGIVIDLSRYLRGCVCHADEQVVSIQGGALWADVDAETIKYGLATVAGTVNHTGVGGLNVGGGYGFLTGQRGLTIDSLVGATVVTADGSIHVCNGEANPDLLWAIRGGGVNFGVVTEFRLRCYPQKETVWAGLIIFPPAKVQAFFDAADAWSQDDMDEKSMLIAGVTKGPIGLMAMGLLFHIGDEVEGKAKFKRVLDIGPLINKTSQKPYIALNAQINEMVGAGRNVYMSGEIMANPAPNVIQNVFELVADAAQKNPGVQPIVGFGYIPLSKVRSFADDSAAFNCRRHRSNVLVQFAWHGDEDLLGEARAWARRVGEVVAKGQGEDEVPYGNYESDVPLGAQRVRKLYGTNYPRLQALKAKYDPNVVFGKWFPIEPAK